MRHIETVCLYTESWLRYLDGQGKTQCLNGFVPRSVADGVMEIDSALTRGELISLFKGYRLLWSKEEDALGREQQTTLVLRRRDDVLVAFLSSIKLQLNLYSRSLEAGKRLKAIEHRLAPFRSKNREENGVWATFSFRGEHETKTQTQFLRCAPWQDVHENYPPRTRRDLDRLLVASEPWNRGRLIIWHGPPGTGKTHALRALMMNWRGRFNYNIVNDPENFASNPEYYYDVAGESTERPGNRKRREPRRILFILEDAADLILQESRSAHFDKIGKLLNMTDGLFGQGREDLFLLTFNEEVERIDPAFLRPGRCVANVDFESFDAVEAEKWLASRTAATREVPGEATIAELYERLHGTSGDSGGNGRAAAMAGTVGFGQRES